MRPTLSEIGVKRVSTGGLLARAAQGAFMRAALELRDGGTFTFTKDAPTAQQGMIADGGARAHREHGDGPAGERRSGGPTNPGGPTNMERSAMSPRR